MKFYPHHSALLILAMSSSLSVCAFAASANSFFITSGTNTTAQTLGIGNTGSVSSGATLSVSGSSSNAITVTGNSTITNNGTILQTGPASSSSSNSNRGIRDNTGGLTLTVTNNAGALMQTADADVIQMNKANSNVTFNNYGTLRSLNASAKGSQAIDFNAITSGSNILSNYAGGVIQATEADAVRPGINGFVYNDGTIVSATTTGSSSDGVDGQKNSGITIVNAGAISGDTTGVGLIEGARNGITGGNTDATTDGTYVMRITNNIGGIIQGDNGSGVNIDGFNANEVVTIVNSGTITGNGVTGDGDAVDVDGIVNITNNGTMHSIHAYNETSEGITVGGGTIINNVGGIIRGSNSATNADNTTNIGISRGITLAGVDKDSSGNPIPVEGIYADTTVTNYGLIKGDTGAGIAATSAAGSRFALTINNMIGGVIEGGGSEAAISTGTNDVTVNNYGTLAATGTGKAVDFGSGSSTLNILGGSASITGDISGGTGTSILNITPGSGNSFSYSDVISNFSTVNIGAGTVTLGGANTYIGATNVTNGGTLVMSDNAAIAAGTTTIDSSSTLRANSATMGTINNAGTVSVAQGKTLTVNGDYSNTGTFSSVVASKISYGKLEVSGTATLGGTLNINVATSSSLRYSDLLSNVIHAGAISGTFATVTDNSSLFNFSPEYTTTSLNLTVTPASVIGAQTAIADQGNTQASGAAKVLDSIITTNPTGEFAQQFWGLDSEQKVSNAIASTLPSLAAGSNFVGHNVLRGINHVVESREDFNRGMSSGDIFYGDKKVWLKPFGSWADQNDHDGVSGYKANASGFLIGADAEISAHSCLGLAVAYAHSNVESKSSTAPQSEKIDLYQFIGYGSYSIDPVTEIIYQADVGNNNNHTQRDILFTSQTASASYKSLSVHVGTGVNRQIALSSAVDFIPSLHADYTTIHNDSYTESGAGLLNLTVNDQTTKQLLFTLDNKFTYKMNSENRLIGNLGVSYNAIDDQASVSAFYAGAPGLSFTTPGLTPPRWSELGGIGFVRNISSRMEVTGRYDFLTQDNYINHTVSANLRWSF